MIASCARLTTLANFARAPAHLGDRWIAEAATSAAAQHDFAFLAAALRWPDCLGVARYIQDEKQATLARQSEPVRKREEHVASVLAGDLLEDQRRLDRRNPVEGAMCIERQSPRSISFFSGTAASRA